MIAVDTNILVYAHREEMPLHGAAKRRLLALASGAATWGIPVFCLGEFTRLVTHPKVFLPPSTLEIALAFVEALATSPGLRFLGPDADYWPAFRDQVTAARASGNLAFDAQIAAICASHGATLLTVDRDFGRFDVTTEFLAG